MNKEQIKELHRQLEEDKVRSKERIAELMDEEHLDEDGYPTEAALEIVRIWHWSDAQGWFEFIKSIWYMSSWGWSESDDEHEYIKDSKVHVYNISTAGWSGNESIIREMQKNSMMWHLNWVQSRRGGHYIFELKEFKE
jgi:hypothetical protein